MIEYDDSELFEQDSLPKNLIIRYDNVTLTNSDFEIESFELTENLCSEEDIVVGACESSKIKFRIVYGVAPLLDKVLTVSILPQGATDELQIGVFKVYSDKLAADRRYRDIEANDLMYDILNADVISWYHTILPQIDSTCTMKQFRDSFFTYFNITQETVTLVNDSMVITKTIDAEKLSGKDVITCICEANGCFGHIGRNGEFKYIYLMQTIETLYPAEDLYPAENLYPSDGAGTTAIGVNQSYYKCEYEDYMVQPITKLQIRQEEDDIGISIGSGSNGYVIEGNFLFYGMSATNLQTAANNILPKLELISYRPATIEVKGNPCFEVGDGVEVVTKYAVVATYILQRTLKGIHSLMDEYEARGSQVREERVNSTSSQISQLKGRTNKLIRTVDETVSELSAYERTTDGTLSSYNTRISQNAQGITALATATTDSTNPNSLQSQITVNAEAITTTVKNGEISSKISQEAGAISILANRLYISSSFFKLYFDGTGNLGGLYFDALGFYSKLNGATVFRVYPTPDDYILSIGSKDVTRLRDDGGYVLKGNNFGFEVDADGKLELTELNVLDEYTGYSATKRGKLHVDYQIRCYGNIECGIRSVNPGGIAGAIWCYFTPGHSASGCINAEHNIYARGWNGGTGDIQAAHDVIYGNSCYQGSDERLKKDIEELTDSEKLIYSLKPKAFRYKRDDTKVHHGFVAQDVEELVDEDSAIIHKDDEGIMSVGYIELIADLVNTVQSQNKRIKDLEERLVCLEEKING